MVLIVDDRPENVISLKRYLELNGFRVDTALSGEEALKKVLKHTYALIILDVQMPVMDGFEVAEAISGYSKARDIPIIFLSAVNIHKKFITQGYASGGIDYVTKPFDPDILLLKVRTFYRLYEQTQELNQVQQELRHEIEVRKEAEKALTDKVRELHSYIESIPQIAFTAGTNGDIEFTNKQWYQYSESRDRFPESHPGEKSIRQIWEENLVSGNTFQQEVRIRKLTDPGFRYHLLTVRPIRNETGIIKWVGTFTDIHEQKLANELLEIKVADRTSELMQINAELEASNHDLQQFASVASHDLKEPLRKIQVFSTIIRDKYLKEEQNGISSYIDRIINSSDRMSGLITDLLTFSRLSVSSLFTETKIRKVVEEILVDLEISITEKKALIHIGELPVLEAIPGQIRQVFQNIISNALKFSRPEIQPEISIGSDFVDFKSPDAPTVEKGKFCRITVTDNGIGFDEKYLNKIFTIFQRLNSASAYEGTGIGLAIAKKIVDKHNGIITAKCKAGEGSSFIIILPVSQTPA